MQNSNVAACIDAFDEWNADPGPSSWCIGLAVVVSFLLPALMPDTPALSILLWARLAWCDGTYLIIGEGYQAYARHWRSC